eukprot:scaffold246643_cov31-Tisochrysis_lutea.AAC.3
MSHTHRGRGRRSVSYHMLGTPPRRMRRRTFQSRMASFCALRAPEDKQGSAEGQSATRSAATKCDFAGRLRSSTLS